nr:ribosomal protein L32 [Astragalus sinicus]
MWQFQKSALLYQKKKIRKNFWKKKGYCTALKAFSLAQSILTGNSKSFFCKK